MQQNKADWKSTIEAFHSTYYSEIQQLRYKFKSPFSFIFKQGSS